MNFINGQLKKFGRQPAKLALLIILVLFGLLLVNLPEGLAEIQTTESEWLKATGFNPWDHIVTIFGNLLILFITLVGHLLLFFMKMVAELFQYNNFIHAQAVEIGWPLMRDLMRSKIEPPCFDLTVSSLGWLPEIGGIRPPLLDARFAPFDRRPFSVLLLASAFAAVSVCKAAPASFTCGTRLPIEFSYSPHGPLVKRVFPLTSYLSVALA